MIYPSRSVGGRSRQALGWLCILDGRLIVTMMLFWRSNLAQIVIYVLHCWTQQAALHRAFTLELPAWISRQIVN